MFALVASAARALRRLRRPPVGRLPRARAGSGRKVAVWYPAAAAEQPFAYTRAGGELKGSVARDAPPAACPRVPLVLFSHGLGGCGLQSTFLTEELARRGYVVAAPDHADAATCGIDGEALRLQNLRTEQPLLEPARWTDQSEIGRLHDLRAAIAKVGGDAALARIADTTRVGAVGHSLGGYAALAMGGAWPAWRTREVKAVVALSPFVAPFIVHGTLPQLAVPVMYQGAQFDWGLTPAHGRTEGRVRDEPGAEVLRAAAGRNARRVDEPRVPGHAERGGLPAGAAECGADRALHRRVPGSLPEGPSLVAAGIRGAGVGGVSVRGQVAAAARGRGASPRSGSPVR